MVLGGGEVAFGRQAACWTAWFSSSRIAVSMD